MAEIVVGSMVLTIPVSRVAECANIIKEWCSLNGDTPQEILDAWSDHVINEVKDVLVNRIGNKAHSESMDGSEEAAAQVREAAETQADIDLVLEE